MNNNNDLDKINKNIYIKSYIVGIIPFLLLVWILGKAFGDTFLTSLLFVTGAFIVWSIFKTIITSITFNLFLKNDLVQKYVHDLRKNNFPKPEGYDFEEVESYFQTIAMDPDNHPQNIIAATMLSEFGHARTQGGMFAVMRLNTVMKEVLKRYAR